MPTVQDGELGGHPVSLGPRGVPHPISGLDAEVDTRDVGNVLFNHELWVTQKDVETE